MLAAGPASGAGQSRRASSVRDLFSPFVADDETAVHCLQGPSPEAVRSALERAGLRPDRIVGADHACGADASCGPACPTGETGPS